MSRFTRYFLGLACLLLLVAVAPSQVYSGQGDPDEVVERIPPPPPPPIHMPTTPQGLLGDPDELPDNGADDENGSGGPPLPDGYGFRGLGTWLDLMMAMMRFTALAAY